MKPIFKNILPLLIVAFSISGCVRDSLNQDQNSPAMDVKTSGDLEFTYQVTDLEGNPQSTFQEGENFMFSFVVKNHGKEDIKICECTIPLKIDDFFRVYQLIDKNDKKVRIGKPFKGIGGVLDLPVTGIEGNSEIKYKIPWINDDTLYPAPEGNSSATVDYFGSKDNDPLPTGKYYSGFTLEYQNKKINFEITFSIE